jgi:hypothetical protein
VIELLKNKFDWPEVDGVLGVKARPFDLGVPGATPANYLSMMLVCFVIQHSEGSGKSNLTLSLGGEPYV